MPQGRPRVVTGRVGERGAERAATAAAIVMIALTAGAFGLVPVVYDTLHLQDTMFLADIGWRVYSGADPVTDFEHLYGGVMARTIALAYELAGPRIKALDYAALILWAGVMALLGVVAVRRVDAFMAAATAALVSAVLFARQPFEATFHVHEANAAHSFVYNRFGTGAMIVLGLFAIVPARVRGVEWAAALIAGVACFVLALTKSTFMLVAPAVAIALLIQARWVSAGLAALGFAGAAVVLDPGLRLIVASLEYNAAFRGAGMSLGQSVEKAIDVVLAHQMSIIFFLIVAASFVLRGEGPARRAGLAGLVLAAAMGATAVSMGAHWITGQQALPLLGGLCLALWAHARRAGADRRTIAGAHHRAIAGAVAGGLVLVVVVPHMAVTLVTAYDAMRHRDLALIEAPPLSAYLARSDDFADELSAAHRTADPSQRLAEAAHQRLRRGGEVSSGVDYALLVDGLSALDALGDVAEHGIVSDGGYSFTFGMQSRPVLGFPTWPETGSPEIQPGRALPDDVDIVMLTRPVPRFITPLLREKMGAFRECRRSTLWIFYVREGVTFPGCQEVGPTG